MSTLKSSDPPRFSSQFGEDRFLATRWRLPASGVFVDVGAGDPVRFSNTYYFERRGWTGVCIDADPKQVEALRRHRTSEVEWAAVASVPGEVDLVSCSVPDHSTLLGHLPKLAVSKGWDYATVRVLAERLETILERHGIEHVDLLSIDTEGTELDVCDSLDWEKHKPTVVVIEHATLGRDPQDDAIRAHFAKLPYRLIYRTATNFIFAQTRPPRRL